MILGNGVLPKYRNMGPCCSARKSEKIVKNSQIKNVWVAVCVATHIATHTLILLPTNAYFATHIHVFATQKLYTNLKILGSFIFSET